MLPTRPEYERFIYTIVDTYPVVEKSTLRFFTTSATAGLLKGAIRFQVKFLERFLKFLCSCQTKFHDFKSCIISSIPS